MEKLEAAKKYLSENELDKASDTLFRILDNNPDHKNALVLLAKIYAKRRQLDKSLEYTDRALKLDDNFWEAHHIKGYSLLLKNSVNSALVSLNKAYEINKARDQKLLENIALAYLKLQQYEKAEQFIDKGLRINPNSDSLSYLLALVYKRKKKPRNIFLEQLEKVKKINPSFKASGISINQILFVNKYIRFPFEEILVLILVVIALLGTKFMAVASLLTLVLFFGYLSYFYRYNKILGFTLGLFTFMCVVTVFVRLARP